MHPALPRLPTFARRRRGLGLRRRATTACFASSRAMRADVRAVARECERQDHEHCKLCAQILPECARFAAMRGQPGLSRAEAALLPRLGELLSNHVALQVRQMGRMIQHALPEVIHLMLEADRQQTRRYPAPWALAMLVQSSGRECWSGRITSAYWSGTDRHPPCRAPHDRCAKRSPG
jgi:hypothetical protein